jgi:hypothetical protein
MVYLVSAQQKYSDGDAPATPSQAFTRPLLLDRQSLSIVGNAHEIDRKIPGQSNRKEQL